MFKTEVLDALKARRSVRRYLPEQIKEEELAAVLEAGTYAPTAMGRQSPVMVAVQDAADIAIMRRLNQAVMGTDSDPFYGAPTVVVVFGTPGGCGLEDASLVMGNLLNAAYAVGLGSCWIHRAKETFETPEGKALMAKWGVPADMVGVGNTILGYAADPLPEARPRKENYVIRG